MSAPIGRLFVFFLVLFAFLIAWTSRWTVFEAKSLNNDPLNSRTLIDTLRIKEGRILADNGEVLAKSVPAGGGTWRRVYPQGSLFSQAVGYFNARENQRSGLEWSDLNWLKGSSQGLGSVFGQTGGTQVGDDVYTTLDPKAQQTARAALAGRAGSVVAIQPRTGAVLAMYSNPTYNDNDPSGGGSQFNIATQGQEPPGSTFKVVTVSAAIDSGKYTPNTLINGHSPIVVSGVPLSNDSGEEYGLIPLSEAMVYSVNTVFAQVAETVGIPEMTTYMKRFGFYAKPPIDLPPSELTPSWPLDPHGHPYPPGSPDEDIGRIGIGQGGLAVTPLQMAMVVAAVANGGELMTPHLTSRVVNQDGQTVKTVTPSVYRRVMSARSAAEVTQMMLKVVEEGTGTPAQIGNLSVAGKTGTAEVGPAGSLITEPWFVAFAPVGDPKVAVAVTVQRTYNGYGATVAAPIARAVIQTLLAEGR